MPRERVDDGGRGGARSGRTPEQVLLERRRDQRTTSSRARRPSASGSTTSTSTSSRSTWRAANLITAQAAARYSAVPVGFDDDTLLVAMADPANVLALDDLS